MFKFLNINNWSRRSFLALITIDLFFGAASALLKGITEQTPTNMIIGTIMAITATLLGIVVANSKTPWFLSDLGEI